MIRSLLEYTCTNYMRLRIILLFIKLHDKQLVVDVAGIAWPVDAVDEIRRKKPYHRKVNAAINAKYEYSRKVLARLIVTDECGVDRISETIAKVVRDAFCKFDHRLLHLSHNSTRISHSEKITRRTCVSKRRVTSAGVAEARNCSPHRALWHGFRRLSASLLRRGTQ